MNQIFWIVVLAATALCTDIGLKHNSQSAVFGYNNTASETLIPTSFNQNPLFKNQTPSPFDLSYGQGVITNSNINQRQGARTSSQNIGQSRQQIHPSTERNTPNRRNRNNNNGPGSSTTDAQSKLLAGLYNRDYPPLGQRQQEISRPNSPTPRPTTYGHCLQSFSSINPNCPTIGHNQPTPDRNTPDYGLSQPNSGHNQPTTGHNSPNSGHKSPTSGLNHPTPGLNQPPSGQSHPSNPSKPFSYSGALTGSTDTKKRGQNVNVRTHRPPTVAAGAQSWDIATDAELEGLSENLLSADANNAAKFVRVNYQQRTSSGSYNDDAPLPLLTVDPQALAIPTISKLRTIYDNYVQDTTVSEYVTSQEKTEQSQLLDMFLATDVMKKTMAFLVQKGVVWDDIQSQKAMLNEIWFTLFSRGGGKVGSNSFEHVFLSEIKNGDISGLHNWIYFSEEESANRANYMGYIKRVDLGQKGAVVKLRFTLNNISKPVNSMFIGTSPELEMALYTTCFLMRPDQACPVSLSGSRLLIRTYNYYWNGVTTIGSAFPEI